MLISSKTKTTENPFTETDQICRHSVPTELIYKVKHRRFSGYAITKMLVFAP